MKWNYVTGDATRPIGHGQKLICHIVNDEGKWGAGFVLALSKRWPDAEKHYRRWYTTGKFMGIPFRLGQVQNVFVGDEVFVSNMVAQRGIGYFNGMPPIRLEALKECLIRVRECYKQAKADLFAKPDVYSIHMPRIGCGLAGSNWETVSPIIEDVFRDVDVVINVYDLPQSDVLPSLF